MTRSIVAFYRNHDRPVVNVYVPQQAITSGYVQIVVIVVLIAWVTIIFVSFGMNAPQTGILGMHATKERPIAVNGKIEIRPMMYVALSYDHRVIDGREAVTFLVRVKECIENPERLLLGV